MPRFRNIAIALIGVSVAFVASLPMAQPAVLITIDKAAQRMTVEVDRATRFVWPVSTGRRGTYETPVGSFRPFRLEEDHYSKEWDEAPMPHSIFFTDGGHAIHGSYDTRRLGKRASHGCVRLSPRNAARLFQLVRRHGLSNSQVVVLPDSNAPIMAKKRAPASVQVARKPAAKPALPIAAPAAAVTATYAAPMEQAYGSAQPIGTPPMAGDAALTLSVVPSVEAVQTGASTIN